jgi:glycerol-1-phosphate dehydrogenase [NAD(P)+]
MLDLSNGAAHRPVGLHGEQVGAAAVVAAAAWQLVFDRLASHDRAALVERLRSGVLTVARDTVSTAFAEVDPSGAIGAECWSDYAAKAADLDRLRGNLISVVEHWDAAAARLRPLVRTPDELASALVAAGATARLTDVGSVTGPGHAEWALTNCAWMRNRLTVVDLLVALGWWEPADIAAILDAAESAVATAEVSRAAR